MHQVVKDVTERIAARSQAGREAYLRRIRAAIDNGPKRRHAGCANLAHAAAAAGQDQAQLVRETGANIAIVTAYNDMLSAHQPFATFPERIKLAIRAAGGMAQVAGGVPAMCDGVTQGAAGMELSLFSRDVIAMATAVALSHDVFDGALYLGVCDKIVPGLIIGALSFGHLPSIFVPAGPMTSGQSNHAKAKIRQQYAAGELGRKELLASELASYHGPGTCTFYGTANSNQMLMEIMGLHLPGASFVNPNTPLRDALTDLAAERVLAITNLGNEARPIGEILDERAWVNAIVGLHATGGSTNHTLHLVAMAAAAGYTVTWDDFADLSTTAPLLCRIYPNGLADVNHFTAAGGMGFLIGQLLDAGLVHANAQTVWGNGLGEYVQEPFLGGDDGQSLVWRPAATTSTDMNVARPATEPFQPTGGLSVLDGKLGRAVIKTSAVKPEHHIVEAPARVFHDQQDLQAAFKAGALTGDFVAVVRFQGPKANGMPELHKLTPLLAVLQDRGQRVALVTDGRMSGASGKVPAAIHVTPEAVDGGGIAKVRDGDIIRLDPAAGVLDVLVDDTTWAARIPVDADLSASQEGCGRDLFGQFRRAVNRADQGASVLAAE